MQSFTDLWSKYYCGDFSTSQYNSEETTKHFLALNMSNKLLCIEIQLSIIRLKI